MYLVRQFRPWMAVALIIIMSVVVFITGTHTGNVPAAVPTQPTLPPNVLP